jgi:2-oxoisovalerate dehydrogenase E1 component
MFFEHKALYRSISGDVPAGYYTLPIGKAARVRHGEELSIITYGAGVHWATDAAMRLGIDADIIDLRSLLPYDKEAIVETIQKTGKALLLHEDCLTGGIAGELAAFIAEHCFEYLDAPLMRCASLDTPVPFAIPLENNFMAKARLDDVMIKLARY